MRRVHALAESYDFDPVIGVVAMTCDVFTIRRFFVADHKYRWPISMLAFSIMTLLGYLLIDDVVHVITHL